MLLLPLSVSLLGNLSIKIDEIKQKFAQGEFLKIYQSNSERAPSLDEQNDL